ncbi:hypothetical protein BT69DRAFT_1295453 [Atractiella rhizophila]|nr:hypothetical protein BT69DRAFT_1295453 [Atractiella rhizophila]
MATLIARTLPQKLSAKIVIRTFSSAPKGCRVALPHLAANAFKTSTRTFSVASVQMTAQKTTDVKKTSAAATEKAGKRKKATHPDQPKKLKSVVKPPKVPASASMQFAKEFAAISKAEGKKYNMSEMHAAWKNLSPTEREVYKQRSLQAKRDYEVELQRFMASLSPAEIEYENRVRKQKASNSKKNKRAYLLVDPRKPKRPINGYLRFNDAARADPAKFNLTLSTEPARQGIIANQRLFAEKWRTMSDEEKRPFVAEAEQELAKYEIQLAEYKRERGTDTEHK